jgi:glutaredoxin
VIGFSAHNHGIMKRLSLYRSGWPLALLWLATTATALAQPVYRSVGPDGRVVFSDRPLGATTDPASANGRGGQMGEKHAADRSDAMAAPATAAAAPTITLSNLPFELRQVTSRYPVTLYTSTPCAPCDAGRTLLRQRGVPFIERQIKTNDDIEALVKLSGDTGMPFLTIAGKPVKGFSEAEWQGYLDAAGYPSASQLPAAYRGPDPTPLTVPKPTLSGATPSSGSGNDNAAQQSTDSQSRRPRPTVTPPPPNTPSPSNPSGIKF